MKDEVIQSVVDVWRHELPEIARIAELDDYQTFPYAPGTVHNEICRGTGPRNSFMMGKYRCIFRDDLIEWAVRKLKG